eukprot:TRINITY_DN1817_c0_g2_i3.p1 TRINITY_DN1817_c0_g2~~TRINITY_DN1817_c0_g2_i3.p1  ORF type:complete len:494 (-),score=104.19 TRINITY_DN1817_c0_g2_i3:261-1742(-)
MTTIVSHNTTTSQKDSYIKKTDNPQVQIQVDQRNIIMQQEAGGVKFVNLLSEESSGNMESMVSDPTTSQDTVEECQNAKIDPSDLPAYDAFELLSVGFQRLSKKELQRQEAGNAEEEKQKEQGGEEEAARMRSRHVGFAVPEGNSSGVNIGFSEPNSAEISESSINSPPSDIVPEGGRFLERVQTTVQGERIQLPIVRRHTPSREDIDMNIDSTDDIKYPASKAYLGEGSFGRVYKGEWKGKKVAVKIFKEEYQTVLGKECTRIFESEFDIMIRLQHENVVECYGGNKSLGKRVIVMEFMEKGSLDLYIHKNPHPIKFVNYYKVLIGICKSLVYLHPTVVHRDIKPQNILINRQGIVKLADFGLSKFKEATTIMSSNISGTPHYVAPEVLTGKYRSGPKCDIYAVGILMYEMYTRIRPWQNVKDFQIAYCIMMDQRPEIPAACPADLAAMIKRCWAENPDDRPTAHELYQWAKSQSEQESQREEPILLYKPQQ